VRVRLTQLDGKLPNLAIMKLAAFHREQGDEIVFTRNACRAMDELDYGRVYGSVIFTRSIPLVERFRREFPDAIIGGTGTGSQRDFDVTTVEQVIGRPEYEHHDYSLYPDFEHSIGFTMRGCRLACGFCYVPHKEGRPRSVNTIADIYRGDPYPKNVVLLDNDFFGQPREQWEARLDEIRTGGFRVSFNQGINVRLIDAEAARNIASVKYYDDNFKQRFLYTAYDNFKDEGIFRRGVTHLLEVGVNPDHIMVYMLTGYDKSETWDRLFERFNVMLEMGVRPYPMVYAPVEPTATGTNNDLLYRDLKMFQKWVTRKYYLLIAWPDFVSGEGRGSRELHEAAKAFDAGGAHVGKKRAKRAVHLAQRADAEPGLFGVVRRT